MNKLLDTIALATMNKLLDFLYKLLLTIFIACEATAVYFGDYTNHLYAYVLSAIAMIATLGWLYYLIVVDVTDESKLSLGKKIFIGILVFQTFFLFYMYAYSDSPIAKDSFLRQTENYLILWYFIGGFYLNAKRQNGKLMMLNAFIMAEGISMVFWAFLSIKNILHLVPIK